MHANYPSVDQPKTGGTPHHSAHTGLVAGLVVDLINRGSSTPKKRK